MHIIYFLISALSFLVAMFVNMSTGTAALLVFVSIAFLLLGAGRLISDRLGHHGRSEYQILSPEELYHLKQKTKKPDEDETQAPQ